MQKLTRKDLYSLEQYAELRTEFRTRVIEHKRNRRIPLGPITALYFEDRLTIQYQIQEMLRVERIFEADAIQEELDAYNPLIPDAVNLQATFMIEVADENKRPQVLNDLLGIEDQVWLRVEGFSPVFAIADEDLDRSTDEKTSAVHFMRFPLEPDMVTALQQGAAMGAGISHKAYTQQLEPLPDVIRAA
ncbi:MAG: DUF3501 family protein, partial [Gammaproteobacteria bacterium]